ncbi:MAG: 30S ribosomal protein S2 [Candidatus Azambacteria bacterium GW2011_GWE1_42_9]|nr:MAG: 30S ribosomal protein S2 [Candidatus Azambacteria bacterium GW2011_GWF1_41_10]KKS49620.1 MAG: 30S ribosomal protein S2 [Candidatus Azambacteria bacterium GW2011_GWF2_42_22]KKS79009.1 MAG: 30S ribosomal protein S2 [Candidatus Azambacteria bacterium GW2011_GWE1_42_9]KKT03731.1 MAG: 30S ribosomal protein S2 [Candidatus Azambacteria bacterium GW2011_GWD1_43_18]KKT12370.1 MAG: 30S ribosomal protein S2 [Candidatus Azambacteria bacterium GW2011_GWC2_43_27]OGD41512.1 MAG: 30S ribosomal protein
MSIKENIIESNLEAMALSGIHLGASKSSGHPKMKSYIWSNRSAFQVIDLEQSQQCLTAAIDFLVDIRKKNGVILFVGTSPAAKELTRKIAENLNMPFVTERWLGGTFTNFSTINKRVNYLKDLEKQKAAGEFEKYTKYEALKLDEKIKKLRKDLGGIADMNRLPDAIWASSANYDKIAVKEAVKKNIPVIGIVNTNSDPSLFNYPIPANDNAISAVSFILDLVKRALTDVKIAVPVEPETNGKN